jgi:hypothetical protein
MRERTSASHACGSTPFIFVFRAKRADRIKLVFWHGAGVCFFVKRLEDGARPRKLSIPKNIIQSSCPRAGAGADPVENFW